MAAADSHALTTIEQVRAIVGESSPVTSSKIFETLDPVAIDFVKRAPFLLLATVDAEGRPDVSPKGDGRGFVAVEDESTLLIPERKGNRLCFSLTNILATRVTVEQCFFHCAKAFKRSDLWDPSSWGEKYKVSFGKVMAPKLGGDESLEKIIDEMVEEGYRTEL